MKEGIHFYNRYTAQVEKEKVLGESAIRWVYGSCVGRLSLHLIIKRAFFSRLLGWLKDRPSSVKSLPSFVEEYGINMDESVKSLDAFTSFNDFFYRKLKPGARPICAKGEVAFPADARHSGWQDASKMEGVFVKGQQFDLEALLGSKELADRYAGGSIVLSRLCPVDYHRFHFPLAGTPEPAHRIDGPLASVSPYSLSRQLSWLWTNKRELTILHTQEAGDVLLLAVGATGVGAIYQMYEPHCELEMGDEQGYFAFGGSTVMTFFLPNRVELCEDLLLTTSRGLELFARQGDRMGDVLCSD